jgi:hypothetical protein
MRDLVGQTFGRLTVLSRRSGNSHTGIRWLCKCSCGNQKEIQIRRSNPSQSCGCLQRERITKYIGIPPAFNDLFARNRCLARRRGLEFLLNNKFCYDEMRKPCYWCGAEPFAIFKSGHKNTVINYTGLDRRDPNLGYVESNVRPCCAPCNIAKGTMTEDEFRSWIHRIFKHQESLNGRA